jgi:DNA-directed RNA polymerase specialized sigma24 family protein
LYTKAKSIDITDPSFKADNLNLELVYNQYAPLVFGMINRILQNTQAAGDLLHEVFKEVFAVPQNQDTLLGISGRLMQIARQKSIAYANLNCKPPAIEAASVELLMLQLETAAEDNIMYMIAQGHTVTAIANKLNIPVNQVQQTLRKALKKSANAA